MDGLLVVVAVLSCIAGVGSFGIAIPALKVARQSKREAKEANQTAAEALEAARGANEHAARAEARATERHDVDWDHDWTSPGVYKLVNTGEDDAHKVRAVVTIDGETKEAHPELVPGGSSVRLEFPNAVNTYRDELAEQQRRRQKAERAQQSSPFRFAADLPYMDRFFHSFEIRVVWSTALGQHREFTKRENGSLGPWDD